ncbi:MAG TPA: GIY-YIG nuclease family protein [Candidatus Krumholzibacteria bacterium]
MDGFLYVLSNRSMPGLVKIGRSDRHPRIRACELSNSPGVPTEFRLEAFVEVTDAEAAEREVHAHLEKFRISSVREFFEMSPKSALNFILKIASAWVVNVRDETAENALEIAISKIQGEFSSRAAAEIEARRAQFLAILEDDKRRRDGERSSRLQAFRSPEEVQRDKLLALELELKAMPAGDAGEEKKSS